MTNRFFCLLISLLTGSAIHLPTFATETEIMDGAELYHEYCSVCHGDKGDGNSRAKEGLITPPADFTRPNLDSILTPAQMIDVVLHGRPGTAMIGWSSRLSKNQAENIVNYIRNRFMSKSTASGMVETAMVADNEQQKLFMQQALINGLQGDPQKGRVFYVANCATCHGIKGGGDGPRAYFIFPKPRNFLSDAARMKFNRPVLFSAVKYGVRGKEMPAWGKVINDQEIADVVEYVFSDMIQTEKPVQSEN